MENRDELKVELISSFNYVKTNKHSHFSAYHIVEKLLSHKDGSYFERAHLEYDEMDLIQNLILNKKVIIDFCLKHPEVAYDVLFWPIMFKTLSTKDFSGYSKEQILTLPKLCREVIVHPENIYKMKVQHRVDDRLLYSIPEDKPWEALEWIAVHAPDKLKFVMTRTSLISPFGRNNVVEHYSQIEDKSKIPEAILAYIEGDEQLRKFQSEHGKKTSVIQQQMRLVKKMSWFDDNGELLKLFELADGMQITSVEDYKLIATYFRNSDMSVSEFCRKFKINSVEGFKKMCEKIALTDPDFAEFYKENLETKSREYVATIREQIENVSASQTAIPDMLEGHKTKRSLETVMKMGQSIVTYPTLCAFAENVIKYYHERLNSYDPLSTDEQEILKRLTSAEVKFLMPSKVSAKYKSGASINLGNEFAKPFVPVINQVNPSVKNMVYNRKNGLMKGLDSYSLNFDYNSYATGNTQLIMPDGSLLQTTEAMADMAEAYASKHKLFKSASTMSRIVRAIAEGKIQNQAETEEYKQHLQKRVLKTMKECKTLAEYFEKYRELN
ncbi:MAG: hypothetical protein IJA23_02995 [Clostridia bacterium]|nr:hypothetical protein [Clostridia bacterium]